MNPARPAFTRSDQLVRALVIRNSLGVAVAARYMRRKGFSLEAALFILLRKETA